MEASIAGPNVHHQPYSEEPQESEGYYKPIAKFMRPAIQIIRKKTSCIIHHLNTDYVRNLGKKVIGGIAVECVSIGGKGTRHTMGLFRKSLI